MPAPTLQDLARPGLRIVCGDLETTGPPEQDPNHRVVEVCLIEMIDFAQTGRRYHSFVNPERPIPPEATAIHGITDADVADKPVFADIAPALLEFIGDAIFVAHNAEFEQRMLALELQRCRHTPLDASRFFCTYLQSRFRHGMASASLDALCRRYNIDISTRTKHGALIDTELLCRLFVAMCKPAPAQLFTETPAAAPEPVAATRGPITRITVSPDEMAQHAAMLAAIPDSIWRRTEVPPS